MDQLLTSLLDGMCQLPTHPPTHPVDQDQEDVQDPELLWVLVPENLLFMVLTRSLGVKPIAPPKRCRLLCLPIMKAVSPASWNSSSLILAIPIYNHEGIKRVIIVLWVRVVGAC